MQICECRGNSLEAQEYVKFLIDELEQVEIRRIGGPQSWIYIRFPLTEANRKWVLLSHGKRISLLHFFFMRPKDWPSHDCSHVMVKADNLWLEFNHELCFEFVDGLWSKSPRLVALPFSIGAKRPPGLGITDSYYLPFQIVRVPGLEAWLESASSSFCAVPFPQSRRDRKAIYDAYPDADERCRELTSWRMDEAVWKLTDYALIVPRHTISLANSATITGRVPGEKNEGKAPFHLRDLMGVPTVLQSSLSEGITYISEEVHTFSENSQICDRRTIYPKDLMGSLFATFNARQRGRLGVYPGEII
jgi:hypothetical protein